MSKYLRSLLALAWLCAGTATAQPSNMPASCILPGQCGGGGGGVPGLSGTTGNERTKEYLHSLREFQAVDGYKHFYFSADPGGRLPVGSDSNACTIDAPCLTWAKAKTVGSNSCFAHIWMDTDWWDTAADFGTISGAIMAAPSTCGDSRDRPTLVISSISRDPSEPFHTTCEQWTDAQEQASVMFFSGDDAGNSTGFIAVENFHVYRCPAEPFNAQESPLRFGDIFRGNAVALNGYCEDSVGAQNQCHTTHNAAAETVSINVRWKPRNPSDFDSDCTGGSCGTFNDPENADGALCSALNTPWQCCSTGPPFLCNDSVALQMMNLAPGKGTVVSPYTYTSIRGVDVVIGGDGTTDISVVGPVIEKSTANTETARTGVGASCTGAAGQTCNFEIAKTVIRGFNDTNDGGWQWLGSGVQAAARFLHLAQVTLDNNTSHVRHLGSFTGTNGRNDIIGECVLMDGETLAAINVGPIADADEIFNFDIQNSGRDDDQVAGTTFTFDATSATDIAAFKAMCDDSSGDGQTCYCRGSQTDCTVGFFSESSVEISGDAFGALAGTSACPVGGTCHTTGCVTASTTPLAAPIGAFVTGGRIDSFRWNQTANQDMGGR